MYKKLRNRKKIKIGKFKERVILGDILPYEVPLFFSNDNFYTYLINRNSKKEPLFIKSILDGNNLNTGNEFKYTLPLSFKISHKENSFRKLSIIHPSNQIKVMDFYNKYKNLILYYTNISKFSIRKPFKTSSIEFYNDSIHKDTFKENKKGDFEQYNEEYKSYSNFFVYKKYNNLYKFFEDYEFHKSEKKFKKMVSLDISKCFDSIYTHTMPWAIIDKDYIKKNTQGFKSGFGGEFDLLMQKMNYNETNGILIGPEFSRIFAEIILQRIDKNLLLNLEENNKKYKVNYNIYRYVDDYFIFYNEDEDLEIIEKELKLNLEKFNLFIAEEKRKEYSKPIITDITIAKLKLKKLFNDIYKFSEKDEDSGKIKFTSSLISDKFIIEIKAIIKENNIKYKDILNYLLIIIDKNINRVIKKYANIKEDEHNLKNPITLMSFITNLLDIVFFIYSVNPKVSYTIKVSLILNSILDIFQNKRKKIERGKFIKLDIGQIDLIKKKIYDEICHMLLNNKKVKYKEIETIYLLNNLQSLGSNYLLNEQQLKKYIGEIKTDIDYFSLINLINYIGNKDGFENIKEELKISIINKFQFLDKDSIQFNGELTFLLFDLIACPYFTESEKRNFLIYFGIHNKNEKLKIINYIQENKLNFSKWSSNFNFSKEITKKKKIEVY